MMNESALRISTLLGEKYYTVHHKSGLVIYVCPKDVSTTVATLAVNYGGANLRFRLADEEKFTEIPAGVAHFLEHKMFEMEDGVDAFDYFAQTGADANAFTSSLTTCYLFSCTECFDESLEILLDMVSVPHFTEESVARERDIIAQEITMTEDQPSDAIYYGLMDALYENNGHRIRVAGTVDSISGITAETLRRAHSVFYNLRNMALFVCGNVTPECVMSVADAILVKAEDAPFEVERMIEPETVVHKRFYREMQVSKPLFCIGVKDTDISSDPRERMKKQCVMDILNDVLFSRSSPFRNELYESGLISSSMSYGFTHCLEVSHNILSGESSDPEAVYEKYRAYIEQIKEDGIDPAAFERCRRVLYANCVSSFDDASEICHNMMDTILDGEEPFEEPHIIASLTVDDANRVLRSLFREDATAMAVIAPLTENKEETV